MCGIAGAIGLIDPRIQEAVRAMSAAQVHRGPDDSGFYVSNGQPGVCFGFRRLAILDLSTEGHQPMVDPERGHAIVFNGEIYNYVELRRELEARGRTFRSTSDTEVLLAAYGEWGEGVLAKLRGMFAFAIHDPAQGTVLIARDRLGIKPLYYAEVTRPEGALVLFASELRALLASGLVRRDLEPRGLASYLWNGFVVGPTTLVRKVSLLGPGQALLLRPGEPVPAPRRYWVLDAEAAPKPVEESVAALEATLLEATRQHLASDVPLGVFLSGGIDSSAVAALATRANTREIATFHVGFEESAFDESEYARSVARALGTRHIELRLTQERFRDGLEAALASLDQPTFDAINTYFVSRLVREAGFTVALAGTGGDELFGGYRSFRDLSRARLPLTLARLAPRGFRSALARRLVERLHGPSDVPPQTRWGKLSDLLDTAGELPDMYQVAYGLFTREFLAELGGAPGLFELAPSGLPPARRDELREAVRGLPLLSAVSLLELGLFIGERLLRDTGAASMAVSLEVRVPLLDHRVVEAAFAVPDAARFHPLGKKALLRRLALPDLDPTPFERPKAGFVLPIEVWARDRLASEIERVFEDRSHVKSVGLNAQALARLWEGFRAGAKGLYWSRIWAPFVLLDWCRRHGVALN